MRTILICFALTTFPVFAQYGSGVSNSRLPLEAESLADHKNKKKIEERQEEQAPEKETVLGSGSSVKHVGEPKPRKR